MTGQLTQILLLAALTMGKADPNPPEWYTSGVHPKYPSRLYFLGTGVGEDYDAAIASAQAQIARQIQVNVESQATSKITSVAVDEQESVRSEYEQLSKSLATQKLTGVDVAEKVVIKGKHYILLALNKSRYVAGIEEELSELSASITRLQTQADSMIMVGAVFTALDDLGRAAKLATEYGVRAAFVASLDMTAGLEGGQHSDIAINDRIRTIVAGLKVEILFGAEQTARTGKPLPKPIKAKAVAVIDGSSIPIPGARLIVRNGDAEAVSVITGDDGTVTITTTAMMVGQRSAQIVLDSGNLPATVRKYYKGGSTTVEYVSEPCGPYVFQVEIFDENGERLAEVEGELKDYLHILGHSFDSKSDLKIRGKFSAPSVREISSFGGVQYLADTVLQLELLDVKTGAIKSAVTLRGNAMDATNREAAIQKSRAAIALSDAPMAKLINGAEN